MFLFFSKEEKKLWSRCFLHTFKHLGCVKFPGFFVLYTGISAFNVFPMGMLWQKKKRALLDDSQKQSPSLSEADSFFKRET